MTSTEALEDLAREASARRRPLLARGNQRRSESDLHGVIWRSIWGESQVKPMAEDLLVTASAGVTVTHLNAVLQPYGQWLPYQSPDGIDDTLGAVLGMGLDSIWRAGYGSLPDRVVALKVWTPALGTFDLGAKVVKNVAGFNLLRLFLGSRATFGIVLEATLKVSPIPRAQARWVWTQTLDQMPQTLERLLRPGKSWAYVLGQGTPENYTVWAEWHGYPAMVEQLAHSLGPMTTDLPSTAVGTAITGAIPRSHLPQWAREAGTRMLLEWQTGWFWLPVAAGQEDAWIAKVRALGGIAVATHGDRMHMKGVDASTSALVSRLKAQLDPQGILGAWDE